jgi:hypothetical protein
MKANVIFSENQNNMSIKFGDVRFIDGGSGQNGATFYPNVSEDGVLSWTNDKNLENPAPVNIKGKDGKDGDNYILTEADKEEIAQLAIDLMPEAEERVY